MNTGIGTVTSREDAIMLPDEDLADAVVVVVHPVGHPRARGLGSQQHFNGTSLIHGPVSPRGVGQRKREIENPAGSIVRSQIR